MEKKIHSLPLEGDDGTIDARIDLDREQRCGFTEVIYAAGKTPEQVARIACELALYTHTVLATRASEKHYRAVRNTCDEHTVIFHETARIIEVASSVVPAPTIDEDGLIVVASGGTADLPVAEEAALTAEKMGSRVMRLYDVGVAGVHRVLEHEDLLRQARVVIAVAGMEGALPTLIAGLVAVPVIAVPTSVGYGASFAGIAPLLTMLNSCAGGIGVVNIDNGFGAAVLASRINRPKWSE
ncbi:MAG: nickel pincer cofactor biosynthesis protein LarB [Coriobacteriia bacterium]|nr:nickel pincer cofactor biosynthesis protein LarB [Coriobacteriia bacterium]